MSISGKKEWLWVKSLTKKISQFIIFTICILFCLSYSILIAIYQIFKFVLDIFAYFIYLVLCLTFEAITGLVYTLIILIYPLVWVVSKLKEIFQRRRGAK